MSLQTRTKQFTINTLDLVDLIGTKSPVTSTISNQLARSCSSVGANYRATIRARSDREFIAKLNIVLEEIDESLPNSRHFVFWMEVIQEKKLVNNSLLKPLMQEANEITAMTVSSLKTISTRLKNSKL